jgi:CRISPR-associated protein Csm3
MSANRLKLHGRVIIRGHIRTVTGLHIGKGKEGVAIGGVDNPVMRDPLTNEPYIPGSSLKGKLRTMCFRMEGVEKNFPKRADVQYHNPTNIQSYRKTAIGRLFGVPGETWAMATRLVVRDVKLSEKSRKRLDDLDTDLPYTEIKYEASIDRVTARANPRPLERVPADVVFGPFEMVVSIYEPEDVELLRTLVYTMRMLEDDYLGGSGSRGSGKVQFENMTLTAKPLMAYADPQLKLKTYRIDNLRLFLTSMDKILNTVNDELALASNGKGKETSAQGSDGAASGTEADDG